ncbi:hypothetical protein DMN91_000593 [Ooceraea biroi]|uniref:Small RNA 2'-O-methyltransferase n=1 Tax=Ooceraea biroi TaxID=2015173 RepID=A0A026WLC3_OOCBI|nr:uncharacterized protein LOC105277818 [Ooceraea biroi]EZA56852.1 Small RNA 2'-O-methyltransferase [Ooceraea biroi]RLU26796.1 hypothetical protein DMN91_000593 [Ooceraea biroi]
MIFVLFHVLYSLSKYVYKRYHANPLAILHDAAQEAKFHKESCEMRNEVSCDEDAVLPKTQLKFSPPAYIQRYNAVLNVLIDPKYEGKLRKVVDFGCSELGFLTFLKHLAGVEEILCVDIDEEMLERNNVKAKPYTMDYVHRRKSPLTIEICCGSVTQNDLRLQNMDAVICIELVEHMYLSELIDFPHNIFGYIMPKVAIITTPNADFNVLFPNFSGYRHPDHKFEWTREQFQDWAQNIVTRYPAYSVTFHGICNGPEGTEEVGSCTQMAVFHLESQVECIQPVMSDLYKTVARFEYPVFFDSRTDEQKILDEALYYINFLAYHGTEMLEEVPLNKVLSFIKEVPITIDALKSLLVEHRMVIKDGEDGPVVLPFENSTMESESDHSDDPLECSVVADFSDDADNLIAWNDFGSHSSINEPPIADEESLLLQVPYTDWNEESIVIPENRSVTLENTYLFDGEVYPGDEAHVSERPISNGGDTNCLTVNDTAGVTIEELSGNSIPLTLDNNELNGKTQIIQSDALTIMVSAAPSSSSAPNNTTKRLVDIVTIEPPLSQEDELNLRSMQRASTLNCQPHLSVSRSSTSPEPLYLSFELNNSLQNYSTHQNESYQSAVLNNTFCQSEMNEATGNVDYCGAEEDCLRRSKRNFLENGSNVEVNSDCNVERGNITAMEEQVCEDVNVADKLSANIYSSSFQNQPKFTSSPRKMPSTLEQRYIENEDLVPADSNLLSSITETIKKTNEMNIGNSSIANTQISNSVVGTISTTSSSSNDKDTDAKRNTDCSADNKTQQESCSENKEFSASTFTENGDNRKSAAESGSIINHETDVQNVDTYVLSSGDKTMKPEEGNVSALSKLDDINAKAYLDNVLASDSRTNISKRCLSPPKEFLSSKLRRNGKCSSECAKEASVLDDKFVPSSSSEDRSSVQFASMSRNEENVMKEPGNRDVNMSSITRLIDSVETKASSPLETSPNSWSPEIMDSGYPNTASAQDITPEYDLSSIAQDHIPDSESPSVAEAPRFGILEPVEVENGDLANNNRDDEGNNMMAVDADDNEDLQPFIDVLENDLENENDIYVMQNGFPMWLLRILEMANPLDFDVQGQQNRRDEDDAHYVGRDEGFDSSSSENESDVVYNEMENDNEHEE